jgi:hypothetical protein
MINFHVILDEAVKLFHSRNIDELMGHEAPLDLQEAMTRVGIDPADLGRLAPEEAIRFLHENGIDPSDLEGGPIMEQIEATVRR